MKKTSITLVLCLVLLFSFTLTGNAAKPPFTATIEMSPADEVIEVNEIVTITANWSTNRDITRRQWYVNGVPQGVIEGSASSGSSSFDFIGLDAGVYEIKFRIWHHNQNQSDRDAAQSVFVTVINSVVDYPAAPAVANKLLREAGVKNKYDGGNYISDVAAEMGPGTDFRGVKKEDVVNYENAVREFLIEIGALK